MGGTWCSENRLVSSIESALDRAQRERTASRAVKMPSLFRFLVIVAVLAGLGYLVVFSLENFVDLKPREISVTVPPSKFIKR
jgi:cell division septal protein FtsQ